MSPLYLKVKNGLYKDEYDKIIFSPKHIPNLNIFNDEK